jgi:hypothetical protein
MSLRGEGAVTPVAIKGLETLRRRFAAAAALSAAVKDTLRIEAEALAAEARAAAPGALGETVEVVDQSHGETPAYAVGTAHPAGRFTEFGTSRMPATPWLLPLFRARSPSVKPKLGKLIAVTLQMMRGAF